MDLSPTVDKDWGSLVIDRGHLAVCIVNREGRYLHANQAAETLTGYSAQDLATLRVHDLVPPEDLDRACELRALRPYTLGDPSQLQNA